ncbi:Uve UV damage repair endonuclease [uncultured Caudovirales phage]|uniref:Uve UV damage repair endonuclease n=1 Tax=uncultured Caudovirales phage TaxID=2100421 RepID=A0A6J5KXN6_9CAUD|nr:Uve UV damage repair endonuclease [uncultured Caudovirales phage]CAB5208887.1 Uve UV damage repair endonuclease [uncultured Caudovirales phage]
MIKRIGFACKWIDNPTQVNGIKAADDCKKFNTGTTTVAWLNRQSRDVAEQKLWDLMVQNIEATYRLVERVSTLDPALRMVRISSDILPVYTHDTYRDYWLQPAVVSYAETNFKRVGDLARANNVRLSFHPGQFTVLASSNPGIVERSIEEFEYHADMARWMGYGTQFQDCKINVHISGREGPEGIRAAYKRLSPEARNCITIENEENAWGLDDCLSISDIVPIVLDVHHNWIREGVYIDPTSDSVKRVVDSWRGVRPTMHYSISREDVLIDHDPLTAPNYKLLLETGYKKQKLRAHSDFYWNRATNDWALSFLDTHDIMCESKGKNLASIALYDYANTNL